MGKFWMFVGAVQVLGAAFGQPKDWGVILVAGLVAMTAGAALHYTFDNNR